MIPKNFLISLVFPRRDAMGKCENIRQKILYIGKRIVWLYYKIVWLYSDEVFVNL